ncbi:MAG: phosphotransferase [Candidatus Margulisbacteria bacterium]|jgi:Ser/Thr protein kinase RdoA (MazF antagonist)|nr:phosphotransferase [Candidatus Margulisiibacteriota bacterium]
MPRQITAEISKKPGPPAVALDKKLFDDLARDALQKYGLTPYWEAKLFLLSENITYAVTNKLSGDRLMLRISKPGYHPPEELLAEVVWVEHLRKTTAIVTPEPQKGLNGEYINFIQSSLSENIYTCVLYEFVEGGNPDESDENLMLRSFVDLGEINGYLHKDAREWPQAAQLPRFQWDFDAILGKISRVGRWQDNPELDGEMIDLFGQCAAIIEKRLRKYGKNKNNYGLIHADLRLSNLLVDGMTIRVIDFDDCGFSWYMFDAAAALSFIAHKPLAKHLLENWLSGYQKVLPIAKADRAEIDTLIMARQLSMLGWLGCHQDSGPAKELNPGYTDGTVLMAEEYLRKHK